MLVRSGQVIRCTHHQSCPPSWKVSPCVYNWPSIPKGFSWFEDLQPRRSSNQLPPKGGPGSYKTHVLSSRRRAQANARLESRAGRSGPHVRPPSGRPSGRGWPHGHLPDPTSGRTCPASGRSLQWMSVGWSHIVMSMPRLMIIAYIRLDLVYCEPLEQGAI